MPTSHDRIRVHPQTLEIDGGWVWTTRRTREMVLEARRLSGLSPAISQGGYNAGGVKASAGTHDRDALDFATAGYSADQCRRWESALWQVGFAAWWRRYIWNVWPQHHHAIPKGGDISAGAARQVAAFKARRDGLISNRLYPRIGVYAGRTWDSYKATKRRGPFAVSLGQLNDARERGGFNKHVRIVQLWLRRLGFYRSPVDGVWGSKTQAAYDKFRRSLGWSGSATQGPVGAVSLKALRTKAKSPRRIRRRK